MRFKHNYNNFKLSEFIASDTATRKGIDNTPSEEQVAHLEELVATILQPLRTRLGFPLKVTSGYRCPALNKAVGGSATSGHLEGWCADIQPSNMAYFGYMVQYAEQWLKACGIPFDQSIVETSGSTKWWHIGIRNLKGQQRRQFLALNK